MSNGTNKQPGFIGGALVATAVCAAIFAAFQYWPTGEPVPDIALPSVLQVDAGVPVQITPKLNHGKYVEWIVPDDVEQDMSFELADPNARVFKSKKAGVYSIYAYTAKRATKGVVPTKAALCKLTVGHGPGPVPPDPPGPGPVPPGPSPIPPGAKLYVSVVIDNDKMTPELGEFLRSTKWSDALTKAGHKCEVLDYKLECPAELKKYIDVDPIKGPPAYVAQLLSGGKVAVNSKLTTEDEMLKTLGATSAAFGARPHGLGWIKPPAGKKWAMPTFSEAVAPVLPESLWVECTLRPFMGDVLDQDGYGACVGHGSCKAAEGRRRILRRQSLKFSPWFCYSMINGGRDNGAMVGDALESLKRDGIALWDDVPYGTYQKSRINQKAFDSAKNNRVLEGYQCPDFETIATAVQLGYPVSFGVEIGGAFRPDSRGVIPDQRGGGGGHCMCAIGLKKWDGRWYLEVMNSWGPTWGAQGFCYMPKSYFSDSDNWAPQVETRNPIDPPIPPVSRRMFDGPLWSVLVP